MKLIIIVLVIIISTIFYLIGKMIHFLFLGDKAIKNRLKLYKNTKISDVKIGTENKIEGKIISTEQVLKTPIKGEDCIWYKLEIYHHAGIENSGWKLLTDDIRATNFEIKDETGEIKIISGYMNVSVDKSILETEKLSENNMKTIFELLSKMDPQRASYMMTEYIFKIKEKWIPIGSEIIIKGKCYKEYNEKIIKSDKIKFMTLAEK